MTKIDESIFLNAEKFYVMVDTKVFESKFSYLDAVMCVCDDTDISPEDLVKKKLISPMLKEKLRSDGIEMGVLVQESTLPL